MTALERKNRTESFLQNLNIPINHYLPCLQEEEEVKIRSPKEIAKKILILVYLNVAIEDGDKNEIREFLMEKGLWNDVSENEKILFDKETFTEREKVNISWRTEAIWTLLWCINKVEHLELPIEQCLPSEIFELLPEYLDSPVEFINSVSIRSVSEILDMTDLIYRIHWATREADIKHQEIPGDFDSSIIFERHYAMNWVTFYADDWDEITTDT
jgi:hypothetical protein